MMIVKYFQFLCLFILFSPHPAMADAMHYTTLGAKKGALNPPDLSIKSLNFAKEEEKRKSLEESSAQKDKTFEAVWDRYRALAEGKMTDTVQKEPQKPSKPKLVSIPRPTAMPRIEPATASEYKEMPLAETGTNKPMGILDRYEQSKAKRSQMKSIRIGKQQTVEKNYTQPLPENGSSAIQ